MGVSLIHRGTSRLPEQLESVAHGREASTVRGCGVSV